MKILRGELYKKYCIKQPLCEILIVDSISSLSQQSLELSLRHDETKNHIKFHLYLRIFEWGKMLVK